MNTPTTYKEALEQGYRPTIQSWERGYVSRKADPMEQPVYEAGGRRKGLLFVRLASNTSSTFCVRQYLKKS
jgi:hypothetical protein